MKDCIIEKELAIGSGGCIITLYAEGKQSYWEARYDTDDGMVSIKISDATASALAALNELK